jgi:hypothetical protein
MADYTDSKDGLGRIYPENTIETSWEDLEPLITPEKLIRVHLFGIPLVSNVINPLTRKPDVMTKDHIKEQILEAVSLCESDSKLAIFPRQHDEKQPFDRVQYQRFGYFQLRERPITSIQSLTVNTASGNDVYVVPLDWIDVGYLHQGQINILPLTISVRNGGVVPILAGPGGSAFLSIFGNNAWIAGFWKVRYTTGFEEGKLPKIVNQYIGVMAAIEILSLLGATHSKTTSTSLNLDGMGQSVSGPGPNIYASRIEGLVTKRERIKSRLQHALGMGIMIDNV